MSNAYVVTVTDETFDSVVKEGVVLVDFWAPWCGPCRMLGPVIDELAETYNGKVCVGKVNVDENSAVAKNFGIMSIPTIMIFANGELKEKMVGVQSKARLSELLDKLLSE